MTTVEGLCDTIKQGNALNEDELLAAVSAVDGPELGDALGGAAVNGERQTLLHLAACAGNSQATGVLLKFMANPNLRCGRGYTALHNAAFLGHSGLVTALTSHRVPSGSTAGDLDREGDAVMVPSVDVDAREPRYNQSALHIAAWQGHADVVQILLSSAATPAALDRDGWTPLRCAASRRHAPIVSTLEHALDLDAGETSEEEDAAMGTAEAAPSSGVTFAVAHDDDIDMPASSSAALEFAEDLARASDDDEDSDDYEAKNNNTHVGEGGAEDVDVGVSTAAMDAMKLAAATDGPAVEVQAAAEGCGMGSGEGEGAAACSALLDALPAVPGECLPPLADRTKADAATSSRPPDLTQLVRKVFDIRELMHRYPPRFRCANKRLVMGIAQQALDGSSLGTMTFSRYASCTLPSTVAGTGKAMSLRVHHGPFDYAASSSSVKHWYPNFAHSNLFVAYSGSLMAQDELQVCEHPALGSLRECLVTSKAGVYKHAFTAVRGQATPVLISGVPRAVSIATDRNAEAGRPYGLYGNRFARASPEAVTAATAPLSPVVMSNIYAIEACTGGFGRYSLGQIRGMLTTAFTAFAAAVHESSGHSVVLHVGFWGCGAYGGNRSLMMLLQLLAARAAGVGQVCTHVMSSEDAKAAKEAYEQVQLLLGPGTIACSEFDSATSATATSGAGVGVSMSKLLMLIEAMGYCWGVSNGT